MPQHALNFISGLPRSGSTLLSAILRQNPRFSAGMSSPVANLFDGIITQVSAGSELSAMVSPEQRKRLLRGLFEGYYADNSAEVIFDTNRSWTAKMPEVLELFPNARFICCVRNVSWVMDSLERQFRSKTFENTGLFGNIARSLLEPTCQPSRPCGLRHFSTPPRRSDQTALPVPRRTRLRA